MRNGGVENALCEKPGAQIFPSLIMLSFETHGFSHGKFFDRVNSLSSLCATYNKKMHTREKYVRVIEFLFQCIKK